MNLWYSKNEKGIEENKYIIMMDLNPNELEKMSKKDKVVEKYMSEVKRINENPFYYEYMNAEEDNRKIENSLKKQYMREGMKKGIKKGIRESNIKYAKKMLEEGIDLDIIMRITGLDKEEINQLQEENV